MVTLSKVKSVSERLRLPKMAPSRPCWWQPQQWITIGFPRSLLGTLALIHDWIAPEAILLSAIGCGMTRRLARSLSRLRPIFESDFNLNFFLDCSHSLVPFCCLGHHPTPHRRTSPSAPASTFVRLPVPARQSGVLEGTGKPDQGRLLGSPFRWISQHRSTSRICQLRWSIRTSTARSALQARPGLKFQFIAEDLSV